jgi:hypothetical protein
MNESLKAWRTYYCDSSEGSQKCARYALSVRGEVVPLGLLPNGRHAQHIQMHAGEPAAAVPAGAAGTAGAVDAAGGAAPVRVLPADGEGLFQPVLAADEAQTVVFRPVEAPLVPRPRSSPETSPPPPPPREPRPTVRRWWTRLTDWMKARYE